MRHSASMSSISVCIRPSFPAVMILSSRGGRYTNHYDPESNVISLQIYPAKSPLHHLLGICTQLPGSQLLPMVIISHTNTAQISIIFVTIYLYSIHSNKSKRLLSFVLSCIIIIPDVFMWFAFPYSSGLLHWQQNSEYLEMFSGMPNVHSKCLRLDFLKKALAYRRQVVNPRQQHCQDNQLQMIKSMRWCGTHHLERTRTTNVIFFI